MFFVLFVVIHHKKKKKIIVTCDWNAVYHLRCVKFNKHKIFSIFLFEKCERYALFTLSFWQSHKCSFRLLLFWFCSTNRHPFSDEYTKYIFIYSKLRWMAFEDLRRRGHLLINQHKAHLISLKTCMVLYTCSLQCAWISQLKYILETIFKLILILASALYAT